MFENKPLSPEERSKLNSYYLDVVKHYERVTNQSFMRDDLVILKLLVEVTTPAVIKKQISVFYQKYPDNFNSFSYIYRPTRNMFKNKKTQQQDLGGTKLDKTNQNEIDILNVLGKVTPKTKEDEGFEKSGAFSDEQCPYGVCNGSGFIKDPDDSSKMIYCQCGIESKKKRRLKNAHIKPSFFDKDFTSYDDKTRSHLFKPLTEPVPFKTSTKIKEEINEPVDSFIKRNYVVVPQERKLSDILNSFCEKNLSLMNDQKKPANLLLFGESGNGKTTYASLIGKYFLEQNKSVYFSTTQSFLDKIFDKEIDPKEIARKYDVLILDELFAEYHTDSQYAKKQLVEFFKIRDELGKMTICTSNGNPRDFSLLYGKSIMSLLNGTFFLFMLERDTDARVENIHQMYNDFDF